MAGTTTCPAAALWWRVQRLRGHELPRIAGVNYTAFVDPSGGSSDSMTLAIAHVESDAPGAKRAVVDLIREVKPPFSPDAVVAELNCRSLAGRSGRPRARRNNLPTRSRIRRTRSLRQKRWSSVGSPQK